MADYRSLLEEYRAAGELRPDTERRLRDRLRAPRRRLRTPIVVLPLGLALAAAVLLTLLRPPTPVADVPLTRGELALTADVQLSADGEGNARQADERIEIAWSHGALAVEVEPNRGVQLAVVTDEARVMVVGTGFTVHRDALGTHVTVAHGRVEVDCAFGGSTLLVAEQTRTCLPRTAAGAVGRIRSLQARGIGADVTLDEIDAALARPDARDAAGNELGAMRVHALLTQHRETDALAAAEHALRAWPGARDLELRRVAARLHVAAGDCAAALPHLESLAGAGALGEDSALVTLCSPETR
ncbi:MAG: FecR domain-containing protein [Myxococcota bacterium]